MTALGRTSFASCGTDWCILLCLGDNGDLAVVRHDTKEDHEQEQRKG